MKIQLELLIDVWTEVCVWLSWNEAATNNSNAEVEEHSGTVTIAVSSNSSIVQGRTHNRAEFEHIPPFIN